MKQMTIDVERIDQFPSINSKGEESGSISLESDS